LFSYLSIRMLLFSFFPSAMCRPRSGLCLSAMYVMTHATCQGCQMVCFQTKNSNLGKFWMVLQWKMWFFNMDIWSIFRPFDICYGHLVLFVVIWYIFSRFGMLNREKSGNPATCTELLGRTIFFSLLLNNLE
jgi:hypothetical protein